MGFRLRSPPAKQQGSGSQGQPSPALQDCERWAGCENGWHCLLEQRRGEAVVCSPRSFSCPFADCSTQELSWCRWGAGTSVLCSPPWLGGHCWGLGEEGLRTPSYASPGRRTLRGWFSGSGDPQQISRVQVARDSPATPCPKSSGGLGAKTACIAFLSNGAVGQMLLREELFLSLCRLHHPGAVLVPLGSRDLGAVQPILARAVLLGHGRRRPTHIQSCFPVKENT